MTWDHFKWGYLRLALGWCQMGFSASAMVALATTGFSDATTALIAMSLVATAVSKWLYSGRPPPGTTTPASRNSSMP